MANNPYYEQDTEFVLGFAGSGKSTELVKRATKKTLVMVPTHKAAKVLKDKGLENVYTIHSVLKLVPTINDNFRKKLKTKLKKVGPTDLDDMTDIFIDEFSMISEEILNILMGALPDKCKVTMFGDPYQLPPVTGEAINPWEPITELTTQYRSKNKVGTDLFMMFMNAIKNFRESPQYKFTRTENWQELFNPDTDRILAFTNKRVIELNNMVAGDKPLTYNEPLLMNGIPVEMVVEDYRPRIYPTCISKGVLMKESDLMKAALKATNDIQKWKTQLGMYKEAVITVEDTSYLIYYDPDHYATANRLKNDVEKYQGLVIKEHELSDTMHVPTWCRENRSKKYVFERGKAWSKYLAHTNYVFSLTRPYATTVHKAQGSEFSKVFVDVADIDKAMSTEQYQRLMYVSLSRAINEIIFI